MHAAQSPIFAEYLLLAEEVGWGDLVDTADTKIGRGDVLLVVDMQNDFLELDPINPNGGAFAVAEGNSICFQTVQLMEHFAQRGGDVLLTRDYHPKKHCSFLQQKGPFPEHCVQGTNGSFFYEPIAQCISRLRGGDAPYRDEVRIAVKGFHEDVDSFGAFEYPDEAESWERLPHTSKCKEERLHGYGLNAWTGAVLLDNANQDADPNAPPDVMAIYRRESLSDWLQNRGTERLFVCGLALDYCVLDTVLGATKMGFRNTQLVLDSSRAMHLKDMGKFGTGFLSDPAIIQKKLKNAGAKIVPTAAILPGFTPSNPFYDKAELKHGFPKTLGPFALCRCKRLSLWVDREKGSYKATSPLDVIRQLEDRDIPPTGRISHPVPLTLKDEVKKSLKIPQDATEYCWAYPVSAAKWTDQALAYFSISTPSAAFFVYGGYVYFDRMGRVKGVFAVSLGNGLSFEPGQPWDQRYTAALENRWVHITVPYLLDKGARFFAWINGGEVLQPAAKEVLGGEDWKAPQHGCFVYKFSESPQLTDDRDVYFAVVGSGEDSKAFGRMGAEEQALQSLRSQLGGDTLQSANLKKVEKCLQAWDANRDGKISEDEMAAALKTLNPKISPDSLKRIFSQADLNKDGFLDVDEFISWLWPESRASR